MEDSKRVSPFQLGILGGLQQKPLYQGTAHPPAVTKRRAKNKRAAASRREVRRRG